MFLVKLSIIDLGIFLFKDFFFFLGECYSGIFVSLSDVI